MKNPKFNFPAALNQTYLNTPANGLISTNTTKIIQDFHKGYLESGSPFAEKWMENDFPKVRETVDKFIDAPKAQIALVPSFSFGYNALLDSIGPLKTQVYKRDYPSLKIPLELKGFELFELEDDNGFEINQELIFKSLKENKIELLVLSHVQFRTGYLADLKSIGDFCKQHKILFIVDTTQSAGAIPISFQKLNVDALIWSSYKWMNSGFANGVMCLKSELIDKYPPKIGGYGSCFFEGNEWIYRPSSRSYEPSAPNMATLSGLQNAMEEKLEIGVNQIREHNVGLLQYCISKLDERGVHYYGKGSEMGKRAFVVSPANDALFEKLKSNKIVCTYREGCIRLGFHFYNDKQDVDRLLKHF